jgi:17beta-estradiol 17-dehydrogenase / very-long-chain 3-oxoacyl-CoA reductase
MLDYFLQAATATGAFYLAFLCISFLKLFIKTKRYSFKPQKDSYALISGASDGIGKEFAMQLAKKGYNVVIMARSKDKLEQVAQSVKEAGKEAIVIPFDFSTTEDSKYQDLKKKIDALNIEVLVNNVGVSHDFPVGFLDEDPAIVERIMQVNCHSMMRMTRLVVPKMVTNRKGLVLNIGSFAGKVPSGLLAVYAASKA